MDSTELRPPLAWFAREMEKKLLANDHKTHWRCLGCCIPLIRATEEIHEAAEALGEGRLVAFIVECADAANFLMMAADNARAELEARTEPRPPQ